MSNPDAYVDLGVIGIPQLLILDGTTGIPKGIKNESGQSLLAQVLTFAQLNALTNVSEGTLVTVSDINYATFVFNGGKWTSNSPLQLMNSGIPFVVPPEGTVGTAGALTLSTGLPEAYPGSFTYFPANAVNTGAQSAAGWYFTQYSSTVAGTIAGNVYPNPVYNLTGDPDESAPIVAGGKYSALNVLSGAGGGAYTSPTTAIQAQNYTAIYPNLVGQFGGLQYQVLADRSSGSTAGPLLEVSVGVSGGTVGQQQAIYETPAINAAALNNYFVSRTMLNLGGYKTQVSPPLNVVGPAQNPNSTPSLYTTVDFTGNTQFTISITRNVGEYYVVPGVQLSVIFS
jgi:hypothetical protein